MSVEQKQLISFARALAFDQTIMIPDEAPARSYRDRTAYPTRRRTRGRSNVSVIAHRLSTIKNATASSFSASRRTPRDRYA
ncbi:MAG: hypothetical protein IPK01_13320 [Acidobacteria bacterium]|nr:hypothetical protein [Acidobacteriota bacterium]